MKWRRSWWSPSREKAATWYRRRPFFRAWRGSRNSTVELVRDRRTKERATTERDALVMEAFARGLLVLAAGPNTVRLSPPLILTKAQAETAVHLLDESLTAIS
jgi:4-aminobutyrate aminotransferase-like enzyme